MNSNHTPLKVVLFYVIIGFFVCAPIVLITNLLAGSLEINSLLHSFQTYAVVSIVALALALIVSPIKHIAKSKFQGAFAFAFVSPFVVFFMFHICISISEGALRSFPAGTFGDYMIAYLLCWTLSGGIYLAFKTT